MHQLQLINHFIDNFPIYKIELAVQYIGLTDIAITIFYIVQSGIVGYSDKGWGSGFRYTIFTSPWGVFTQPQPRLHRYIPYNCCPRSPAQPTVSQ